MNEEALNTLYSLAKEEGYSKSFDEFKLLMSSNNEAINTMYNVSKNNGYTKTIDDFKVLVGNKKQQADSNPVKKKRFYEAFIAGYKAFKESLDRSRPYRG